MSDYKKIKYRYFILSFAAAFLVLAVLLLALVSIAHSGQLNPVSEASAVNEEVVYTPSQEDALSVLFMGIASEEDAPALYMLIRFNPMTGTVPIAIIPPHTALDNNGRRESISEVYSYGGAAYTRDILEKTLGIPVDRYVRLSEKAFIEAADAVGSVEFDLPRAIELDDGARMTLNRGRQLLDGQKAASVIKSDVGESSGERFALTGALVSEIINQRMDIVLSTVSDNIFEIIINLIDSDLSWTDYISRKDAAVAMAESGERPAIQVTVNGEEIDGGLFVLSDTCIAQFSQIFG